MGADSKIEWCDHTFNPWLGCQAVSPACDHCYAEAWAKRSGLVEWGPKAPRRLTTVEYWRKPLAWNAAAARAGERRRVFPSLCDPFDKAAPPAWRMALFARIVDTPSLDWLLLTKRPQNIPRMLPPDWGDGYPNVWLGTTVENQAEADRRIPALLAVPATLRFLSCEPLLGPVDLAPWVLRLDDLAPSIDWVIAGGESGGHARPSHPDWFRDLRDQCAAAAVPFFFKQWGEWIDAESLPSEVQEHYDVQGRTADGVVRVGKSRAGRLLDGVTHDAVPDLRRAA